MWNYRINVESIYPDVKIELQMIKNLVKTVLSEEGISQAEINIILANDKYIIKLNQDFLNKDITTDVLSFNLEDEPHNQIEGEVYVNIEQIKRQARDFQVTFREELFRILIHGVLHLIGFNDQKDEEKAIMTKKEDNYLASLNDK
ncbi:MAG: rRNA maturation RNase YbeY [bacterium]|nr:MAG: rRNA maturation RNase YbeY [bacterium]